MQVNEVRVAEDKDFEVLKIYLSRNDGWRLEYERGRTAVWTRAANEGDFRMIRLKTTFSDVSASVVYDVLQDPVYRRTWDKYMVEIRDIGHLNPNNNIGYYSLSCPPPLKNRDFVIQSSWLETPNEFYIINHSVYHADFPPRKGFVRAISYLTGFLIRPSGSGCEVGYVTHSNPRGRLPTWVINKVSSNLAPRLLRRLHKACHAYPAWKKQHAPHVKHWLYPEQITTPRINMTHCVAPANSLEDEGSSPDESLDEEIEPLENSFDSGDESDNL